MLLLNPALGDRLVVGSTDQLLSAFTPPAEPAAQPAHWLEASEEERRGGLRLRICHGKVWGLWGGQGGGAVWVGGLDQQLVPHRAARHGGRLDIWADRRHAGRARLLSCLTVRGDLQKGERDRLG